MYYLGVDLGGTNIAVGLVNEQGEIVYKDTIPTGRERHYKEILKDITKVCLDILDKNSLTKENIYSIGVGSPGVCDFEKGIVVYASNLNFSNTPIKDELEKQLNIPVYLDNDANCAAYGESISGACKSTKNSITITLGTGVGGGAILNNQILRGQGSGGEFGHHVVVVDGEICGCGRKGCWESYASATGLIKMIKKAAKENPESLINVEVNNNIEKIVGKTVFDAADKGDQVAKEVIKIYLKYVSEGLANLVNIFDPEIIAIGGGVAGQGEKILVPIRKKLKKLVYGGLFTTKIVTAELGNDAGIIGAAFLGN